MEDAWKATPHLSRNVCYCQGFLTSEAFLMYIFLATVFMGCIEVSSSQCLKPCFGRYVMLSVLCMYIMTECISEHNREFTRVASKKNVLRFQNVRKLLHCKLASI